MFLPALLFVCTKLFPLIKKKKKKKKQKKKQLSVHFPLLTWAHTFFLKKKDKGKREKKKDKELKFGLLGKDESLLRLTIASFNEN